MQHETKDMKTRGILLGLSFMMALTLCVQADPLVSVLTYHNDNTRSGQNTNETILTAANVNTNSFGLLFSYPVDGHVYAQPLYVPGVIIPGRGAHNVVFVATQHNTVYALDADDPGDNGGLLWKVNLGTSASLPTPDFGWIGNVGIDVEVGITGTPVIDPVSGTLFVDTFTHEGPLYYLHRLHALNITNGAEQTNSPVVVTASVPGLGDGSVNGVVTFDPIQQLQRPALTLAGGVVYIAYGSYSDRDPYHGWIIGFDATTLQQLTNYTFNTTPNGGEGALWMSGAGLSVDANTNLYFETGNGSFDANTGGTEYGDSFVKLSTAGGLSVADYFTPYDQATLAEVDADLGSGGTLVLPDSVGSAAHPHLIVGSGKEGTIYLLDRDNLGQYNGTNDSQIVEALPQWIGGTWSSPAYFNNLIYYQGLYDALKAFQITNGWLSFYPASKSLASWGYPPATPAISANGTDNAILWAIQADGYPTGPAILHAYNAYDLSQELYNSSMAGQRDNPGATVKFTVPTVANGKVYVGAQYMVSVFGNASFTAAPQMAPNGGSFTNSVTVTLSDSTPGASIYYTVDNSTPTTNSILYTGPVTLTNSLTLIAKAFSPGALESLVVSATFVAESPLQGQLVLAPSQVDFGFAVVGGTAQATVLITNLSAAPIYNVAAMLDSGPFSIQSGIPFNLDGFGSTNLVVEFDPACEGAFSNYLAITTDNAGTSTNLVTGSAAVPPTASFVATPTAGAAPLTVAFADNSTGTITNRFWDWGDGTSSNTLATSSPHIYNKPGTNTVVLTVIGPLGTNLLSLPAYIVVTNLGPVTITIAHSANRAQLSWSNGILQSSSTPTGNYIDITNAVSPYLVPISAGNQFFRVRIR
jgi:PKD repeat protein